MIRTVYIAAPYTASNREDTEHNVQIAISVAEGLWRFGFHPFIPHLFHYWNKLYPHDYEFWMKMDQAWIRVCDAVLKVGTSPGVERDVEFAKYLGKPVFDRIQAMIDKNESEE